MKTNGHTRNIFLAGPDVEREAKRLISQPGRLRVAVAYWGDGSVERLDIEKTGDSDVTIVCDLMSGACNPIEIKRLQGIFGESRILMRDRLHAKVWLTDREAIVGSSNISANGLGFEGDELKGSIEANLLVDDIKTLAAIGRWFENDVMEGARKITEVDFQEACRRWKRHRANRPPPSARGSFLDVLRTNPSFFADRNFVVWVYEPHTLSSAAEEIVATERKRRHNDTIEVWENIEGSIPPPGAFVLEFHIGPRTRRARLDGLWQVLQDKPFVKKNQHCNVLLCKSASKILDLPLGNRKPWESAATLAAANDTGRTEWTIEEFSREFLSNKA